ncbi:hypothetical protein HW115_11095 [Verrucomicrobiaceae bacterium N1E253]|uniref:Uncharacterized protein n=1 Tax=Oceaniferula marina TaxID=2748318 RepID=A0A851GM75_9BACT|nr:hypothetical protein [Oceaniferula marina]NWK56157.1 hypothetical protein [Oceaniferula marina]
MPDDKVKTIEIDEVLPADGGEGMKSARHHTGKGSGKKPRSGGTNGPDSGPSGMPTEGPDAPFPDLRSSLGWKARVTLALTQGFLFLRSKSWGKWVIAPAIFLLILIAIPVAIFGMLILIITSILRPQPRR